MCDSLLCNRPLIRYHYCNTHTSFNRLRNRIIRDIEHAKQDYYKNRVAKLKNANPASWYKHIKTMTTGQTRSPLIRIEGTSPTDFDAAANKINNFFVNIANDIPRLDPSSLPSYLPADQPLPLVQPWEVYSELKAIKQRKAPGPDGISARLVKKFAYELCCPLTDILNASFSQSIVPERWKRAHVVPIPKTSQASIDNLRPVSLTDHFAKIAEKFIAKWTFSDMENTIDPAQFGNMRAISTSHYLIDLLQMIHSNADKPKIITTMVTTDFSKAFDRIDHNIAVLKLLQMNVRPSAVAWIANFLTKRQQSVKYRTTLSDWLEVSAGAPQGTRLGPIIFLAIINEACRRSPSSYWKYVDDLTMLECRKSPSPSNIQSSVSNLQEWTVDNNMKLNHKKCSVMTVTFMREPPPPPVIQIDGHDISQVDCVKLLGVFIQKDLKWTSHVNEIVKKANMRLHMLRVLTKFRLPLDDLVLIYCSYIRPVLEYCAPVWNSGLSAKQNEQIERIQKRACRLMLGPRFVSYQNALQLCKVSSLSDRRECLCLKFAKKLLEPGSKFSHWLPQTRGDSHSRNLRNKSKLTEMSCKTTRYRNSPLPYLVRLLNAHSTE